jgi:hypothetical protein
MPLAKKAAISRRMRAAGGKAKAKERLPGGKLRDMALLKKKSEDQRKRKLESLLKLEGLLETEFLLRSPKNARRLRSALAQAKTGKLVEHELDV